MILVPVKNLSAAKQRLAPVLGQSARSELARQMLVDVVETLSAYRQATVALVTSDPFALELAEARGFEVIHDARNRSETEAIQMATRVAVERGEKSTLVIPADIPLVEVEDIRAICEAEPERGSVLVPSHDQRGTNAALRRPAALFPLEFGNDSFMPHLAAGVRSGNTCVVLSLARVALDVDTPEDLSRMADAPGVKRSQLLARELGFSTVDGHTFVAGEAPGQSPVAAKT
jgi:2-phospho-L-lactate/phosphoenolpyruvate guanylyltransferase